MGGDGELDQIICIKCYIVIVIVIVRIAVVVGINIVEIAMVISLFFMT